MFRYFARASVIKSIAVDQDFQQSERMPRYTLQMQICAILATICLITLSFQEMTLAIGISKVYVCICWIQSAGEHEIVCNVHYINGLFMF